MTVKLDTYVPLNESDVTCLAHKMVYCKDTSYWYGKVSALLGRDVSTQALLFFVDTEAFDTVWQLSCMPKTMYVQGIIAQSTNDLWGAKKFSMHELVLVAKALVRLNHAVEWATSRGLYTHKLPSDWLPQPISMPRGDMPALHDELRAAATALKTSPQACLFFYEWPTLSADRVVAPEQQKLCFTFRMCATLRDEPVAKLRHYILDRTDDDLFMLTRLSRNSATVTIGALLDNTPEWVERFFGLKRDQMLRLLRTLHSVEYSLTFLSEVKRRGLVT